MKLELRIRLDDSTKETLYEKNADFINCFATELETIPGACLIYYPGKEEQFSFFDVEFEEIDKNGIEDIVNTIEDFMYYECNIREPYRYLSYDAKDDMHQVIINKYVLHFEKRRKVRNMEFNPEEIDMDAWMYEDEIIFLHNDEGFSFPVKYSPEMKSYIKELRQVTNSLYNVGALNQFYTKSLLISMDDGWGYSAFLKVIAKELAVYYKNDKKENGYSEISCAYSDDFSEWEQQVRVVKKVSDDLVQKNMFGVMAYDLSEWTGMLSDPRFLNCLRKMGQYSKNILLVFRVPHMDMKSIRNIEREIANALSIRSMVIPPITNENMIRYFKEELIESDFVLTKGCEDLLEQWICQEKNEGSFYGYKTLDKMVGEVIYQKALKETIRVEEHECVKIMPEDIKAMLNDEYVDENPYEVLNELIGMAQVKTKIKEIVAQIKIQKALEEQGKNVDKPSMHMLFLGSPGTGKTTVARLVGQIFKQEGLLTKGHFIEKTGNEFIYKAIGDTTQKAHAVFRDAYGSVLFIDEAYGMAVGTSSGSTAEELVPIFVAEMENHRDDLCVILAGYQEEMKEFLKTNSGLESRISHVVEFPNYTKEELVEIFFKMVDGKFEYEEALKEAVIDYINNIPEETYKSKEFSNGRFVRNLYEHLWGKAAYRISLSGETDICLKKEDMVSVIEEEDLKEIMNEKNKKKIGFKLNA